MADEMPPVQQPDQGSGVPRTIGDDVAPAQVPPMPSDIQDRRSADELEAHSIKWNVARIVRLSSGNYALLTHYRAGALDLIKVGTLEEIATHIPTVDQCIPDQPPARKLVRANTASILADLGLT